MQTFAVHGLPKKIKVNCKVQALFTMFKAKPSQGDQSVKDMHG